MADQDIQQRLHIIRSIHGGDQAAIDAASARDILREDLGYFDHVPTVYALDDKTRDRLIAHARQDAAHAALSVGSLTRDVRKLQGFIRLVLILLLTLLALEFYRLFLA